MITARFAIGDEIVPTFVETDAPAASLERGDRAATASLARSAGEVEHEGQNMVLQEDGSARCGHEALASWLNPATEGTEQLRCKVLP